MARSTPDAWLAPGVLVGALVPLGAFGLRAYMGTLSANPIAELLNQLGLLALVFLVASLAATPLKQLWGFTWPLRIRRLLGLLAFFYATLHLLTYALLDRLGELATLWDDLTKRPFIAVGALAWLLLLPLALTSTRGMIKRLGFARWQLLHRLSYVAAVLGVVHFLWRVKKDASEPIVYAVVLGILLFVRVRTRLAARRDAVLRG
jgi:sulfoxide reductase heme-binding subunit YedZ